MDTYLKDENIKYDALQLIYILKNNYREYITKSADIHNGI